MQKRRVVHESRRRHGAGLFMALAAAAWAWSGCSSMNVYSDFDPAADFAKLQTWDWVRNPGNVGQDPRLQNALVRGNVESAISDELLRRGFRLAISQEPTFLVAYHLALDDKLDLEIVNDYYGYAYQGNYGSTWGPAVQNQAAIPREYQQGTLVVDVLDAVSKQLVWRGTVEAEVYPNLDAKKREERIRDAARQVLAQFPPR